MQADDRVHLPAAYNKIRNPVHPAAKPAVLAYWNIPRRTEAEDMPRVEEGWPVIAVTIVGVLPVGSLRSHATGAVVAQAVRHSLAEGIRPNELETVAEPLVSGHLQRVVAHDGAGIGAADVGDQRRHTVERSSLLQRQP